VSGCDIDSLLGKHGPAYLTLIRLRSENDGNCGPCCLNRSLWIEGFPETPSISELGRCRREMTRGRDCISCSPMAPFSLSRVNRDFADEGSLSRSSASSSCTQAPFDSSREGESRHSRPKFCRQALRNAIADTFNP